MNPQISGGFSSIEPLEPRIAPAADLIAVIVGFELPGGQFLTDHAGNVTAVPDEVGTVKVKITNSGGTTASGISGVHVYLSADLVFDNNQNIDPLIGRFPNIDFSKFAPDEFDTYSVRVEMPQFTLGVANVQTGPYHLIAVVDPSRNIPESNDNNNADASTGLVNYALKFGEVDGRKNVALHVFDLDETSAIFRLTGGGTGTLIEAAGNTANLSLANTTAKSVLGASTAVGKSILGVPGDDRIEIQNISVPTPLGSASMPNINVAGDINFTGGVKLVSLGDIGSADQQSLFIGNAGVDATVALTFKRVGDLDLLSQTGISLLSVTDWNHAIGGATHDEIRAPFISLLKTTGDTKLGVAGDFEADLTLTGENKTGFTLGLTTIKGEINGATWTIGDPASPDTDAFAGKVSILTVGSAAQWKLDAEGPVSAINVKGDFLTNGTNSPDIRARFFGTINIGGTTSADITATGAADDQRAVKMITGGSFGLVDFSAPKGGINLINVDEWLGGSINASWIGVLSTTGKTGVIDGDFSPNLTLFGVDLPGKNELPGDFPVGITKSIGTALIKDQIEGGLWNVKSNIGILKAGSSDASWRLEGALDGGLLQGTTVTLIQFTGTLAGELAASVFGPISTKGDLLAKITARHVPSSEDFARPTIKSIAAASVGNITVTAQLKGGIGAITVGDWASGSINAGWIGAITTTGDPRDPLRIGNFGADLVLDGPNTTEAFLALRSLKVKGSIFGTTIQAPNDRGIYTITADNWVDGGIDAAFVFKLTLSGDSARDVTGDLKMFTANLPAQDTRLSSFDGSIFAWTIPGHMDFATLTLGGRAEIIRIGSTHNSTINATGDEVIGEFVVMGVKDFNGFLFDRTNILAPGMGKVVIREVNPADTGTPYGITVGSIRSYQRYENGVAPPPEKLEDNVTFDVVGDYRVNIT